MIKAIYYILVLVIVNFTFISCSKNPKEAPALPADCALIAKLDFWTMSMKGGLYELKNTPLYKELITGLKQANMEAFIEYIDNPLKMGIDFRYPTYVFVARDDNAESAVLGFRTRLSDRENLDQFIRNISGLTPLPIPVLKKENFSYVMTTEWTLGWTDHDILFIYQEDVSQSELLSKLSDLLAKNIAGSNKDKNFEAFQKRKADIALWVDYSVFSDKIIPLQQLLAPVRIPDEQYLYLYTDFIDGGFETTLRWFSPQIEDNILKHLRKAIESNPQYLFRIFSVI